MVDRDLFLHDLSVVAILKNEAPYLKEWIEYHLIAGVDHFYLYDNESPDNQAEVARPYVEAGLVDYFHIPGQKMQYAAYTDVIKRFKFFSRYMAFIDGDEFIFPKSKLGGGIIETVDEILSGKPNAGGLAIHWQMFGSNGQETADFSRGVLERFTRRAKKDDDANKWIKDIVNPRKINFFFDPHTMTYFEGLYSVDERSLPAVGSYPSPVSVEKIVLNHYQCKSWEEYNQKNIRGDAVYGVNYYTREKFNEIDFNDEFDDSILKYREARAKIYQPIDKSHADERLFAALAKNLSPILLPTTLPEFYAGKMETFLTCRAVATYLKTKLTDDAPTKFFEEASLKAILKSMNGMTLADVRLLIRELPNLLHLPYPAAKELRDTMLKIIPQMMNIMHLNNRWKDYMELDYLHDILKLI